MVVRLTGAFSSNPRVTPLVDGSVAIPGVEIAWAGGTAGELHEDHIRHGRTDVFEFSISNYLVTRERFRELWDWVMIPVFASKATLGLNTVVNVASGIENGAHLRGKRFGIPDYTMTAGLWFRAQLGTLWDIAPADIDWLITRSGEQSHARQLGFDERPPRGIDLAWAEPGTADAMLQAGDLDAAFPSADIPIDESTGRVRRLFPDGGRSFMAAFQASVGFLPVNHVVLMRRELADGQPWLTEALYEAFIAAKEVAYRRDRTAAGILRSGNDDMAWQSSTFGDDPYAYGVASNRAMLEMAAAQSYRDGLTDRQVDLIDYVAPRLVDT